VYRVFEKLVDHVVRLRCHQTFIRSIQLDCLQVLPSSCMLRHDERDRLMRHAHGA
jgi:hypothetical protein